MMPHTLHQHALAEFVARHPRLFVLTGAGCSTGSGIPDYRDEQGAWKRRPPVMYQAFVHEPATRARYWARSLVGWPHMAAARPNAAHVALATLEQRGAVALLLTQNVDRLHQRAGSHNVMDLHGRMDRMICLGCGQTSERADFQRELGERNPRWAALQAAAAPDGDADLEQSDFSDFVVPSCPLCGGLLKPDVVFFGESVPAVRVEQSMQALQGADAMLVVGSSLMVYSGFRFARAAHELGLPIAAVNIGRTRADAMLSLKIEQPCADALAGLL